jgi:hypothetical protein
MDDRMIYQSDKSSRYSLMENYPTLGATDKKIIAVISLSSYANQSRTIFL